MACLAGPRTAPTRAPGPIARWGEPSPNGDPHNLAFGGKVGPASAGHLSKHAFGGNVAHLGSDQHGPARQSQSGANTVQQLRATRTKPKITGRHPLL